MEKGANRLKRQQEGKQYRNEMVNEKGNKMGNKIFEQEYKYATVRLIYF